MSRISRLEDKLEACEIRLRKLECRHDKEAIWDGYSYILKCLKCGKFFRYLSEQEYLEISIKNNKEQCASDRKELEGRLAKLKEEEDVK